MRGAPCRRAGHLQLFGNPLTMNGMPPSRPPTRYDTRRDRRRITGLLLALGLAVIAITEASRTRNWEWLTRSGVKPPAGSARNDPSYAPQEADDEPLAPGAFRLAREKRKSTDLTDGRQSVGDTKSSARDPQSDDIRIARELLETVQDQSVGIRSGEREAYYAILAKVRDIKPQLAERFGRHDLTYAELMNDPERHRGELVTVSGEIRRFTPLPAGENDVGIGQLYDGWVFTDEAGRKSPYRIICSEKPAAMPEGEELRERVTFTGYFFKRCSYETSHGLHAAPLLLGKSVRWTPARPRTDDARGAAAYIVGVLGLLACTFGGVLWWLATGHRTRRTASLERAREPGHDALIDLGNVETKDATTYLRELSERREENETEHTA